MNKTININLGGFFFHIDENAYKKLNRYLEAIKKSLSDDPQGKNEIISDIEARISELLSEKITDARQVVNEGDIDEIIKIMGQPEDYMEAEEGYADTGYTYKKRNTTGKKLFRDGDDKFLGGVASGIAHYLEIDSIWIRLLLIALFFGGGFGFLIYIILWILLPEAKTTAEKLQMEGEAVNIDNIEKKIREEFNSVSGKIKDAAEDVSEKIKNGNYKKTAAKAKSGFQDFLDALGKIILSIFKIIGKCIGVLLILISGAVLISFIIALFSVGSFEFLDFGGDFIHYPPFFYDATLPFWLLTLFTFITAGIPFLIVFILGLRILFSNIKQFSKATSLTLLGIWFVGIFALGFTAIEFGTSKAYDGTSIKKEATYFIAKDTIRLKVVNDDTIYYQDKLRRSSKHIEVEINGETKLYSNNIKIDVDKSNSEESYLQIRKKSEGRKRSKANKNAAAIEYQYIIDGNTLALDAFFLSQEKNRTKNEQVFITLFVPENTTVVFDTSSRNFLHNVENIQEVYDHDMVNHYFLMTPEGLNCTDCITDENKSDAEKNDGI